MEQLGLSLEPLEPYSWRYFVTHSGVASAVAYLEDSVVGLREDAGRFCFVYVCGPAGSGKRHLCQGFAQRAVEVGVGEEQVAFVGFSGTPDDDEVARFVATYERVKAGGGLLLVCAEQDAIGLSDNPHLASRVRSAQAFRLLPPQEEELYPLLVSILERRNLKLSEKNVQFLLSRLPRNTLSFAAISAKINEISLTHGKPARFGLLREVLLGDED